MKPRRFIAVTAILSALVLSGCTSVIPMFGNNQADETPTPGQTNEATEPVSCDNMISSTLIEEFDNIGWSAQHKPFHIGPDELEGGMVCTWANYSTSATEILQMFGWAPIDADEHDPLIDYLIGEGWVREDSEDGTVFVTEPMPAETFTDENGYGLTYAFHEASVTMSDTKTGLDVIVYGG